MDLRIDASRARTMPLDAVIPAGAAAKAASAGNTHLLEELIVSSLLRRAMRDLKSEKKARKFVGEALSTVVFEVELNG